MSFQSYPQPDACRALMPSPEPPPPGPPSRPMACHMPKGHEGPHALVRRPGSIDRRWEGDARTPVPQTAAVPDPRFRDQLAAEMRRHWSIDRIVNRDGALFSVCGCGGEYPSTLTEHQADALLPLVEAHVQAAANQRAAEELRAMALTFETDGAIVSALADQARAQLDLASEAAYTFTASDFQHVAQRIRDRADALDPR